MQAGDWFGQDWTQVGEFGTAFALSCAIGLEREIRQKAAGLRTYTVVGMGAALFTLMSKYGFADVLDPGRVVLDPSRVAAQIVSGLGFIGAGIIFVQRGSVRGLTSAATIWMTAAVGASAAAGLPVLAVITTLAYFAVSYLIHPLTHRLPRLSGRSTHYRITYSQGSGLLRDLVDLCGQAGFSITDLTTLTTSATTVPVTHAPGQDVSGQAVQISLGVLGRGDPAELAAQLSSVPGVLACAMFREDD
ncbi:putative magnesium transport MgtC family protein [Acrocarpospora corrugata]|uniref:Putative magnesium transport MgtC family protein n=2 Tax=Acrocarpospora corrugata TaxID=35763 RepID=A0A5M3VVS9_9ACTN|nr:putative magnesium transport MgtC family protein [Acrocarpospora corrugata]